MDCHEIIATAILGTPEAKAALAKAQTDSNAHEFEAWRVVNGGILRGLTPRNGWNRLISAIESWNHVHGGKEDTPDEGTTSMESSTSTRTATSTASTMTNASSKSKKKSRNDVMVQADLHFQDIDADQDRRDRDRDRERDRLRERCESVSVSLPIPSTSTSASPRSTSTPSSPENQKNPNFSSTLSLADTCSTSKPISNSGSGSIKCLTWSQAELSTLPQQRSLDDSDDEYSFRSRSPPHTPNVRHLKYLFPVHVTPCQNIEPEARINEKIHRTLPKYPDPLEVVPKIVQSDCENNFVLVRHKLPTLVCPQLLDHEIYDDCSSNPNLSPRNKSPVGRDSNYHQRTLNGPMFRIVPSSSDGDGNAEGDHDHNNADYSQEIIKHGRLTFRKFEPDPPPKRILVCQKATPKKRTHRLPPKIKEFIVGKAEKLHVFESTDEGEFSDCLEIQLNHSANRNYRTVQKTQVEIHEEIIPPAEAGSIDEILLFYSGSDVASDGNRSGSALSALSNESTSARHLNSNPNSKSKSKSKKTKKSKSKSPSNSVSGSGCNSGSDSNCGSPCPSGSSPTSSSSSYESLVFQKPAGHVKVVENAIYEFIEDQIGDVHLEDFKDLEKHVTAISYGEIEEPPECDAIEEVTEPIFSSVDMLGGESGDQSLKPMDGSHNSKFHNFYVRELHQLAEIGRQIKSLRNLSQRYEVLKPYLKQLEDLQKVDWTQEDPELDEQIEHCSGWNVDIEYRKVQNEVISISKILKGGPSPSSHSPTPVTPGNPNSVPNSNSNLGSHILSQLLSMNVNGSGSGSGNGNSGSGCGPRRDSSSTSNRTTSSTSITSDSYSISASASATNTDSRRGSYASSSFVFDGNPLQQQPQHYTSHVFSPQLSSCNLNSNSNPSSKFPPQISYSSNNFVDLGLDIGLESYGSLLSTMSMSSAPNSLPSLFSLNLNQNQIQQQSHSLSQNPNSNFKHSGSGQSQSNNLNGYQLQNQSQQQQILQQQHQHSQYFHQPLNFDYRSRGSNSNMNIENSSSHPNQHLNFEVTSPSRTNYSQSHGHGHGNHSGEVSSSSNGSHNGFSSSFNMLNNYHQRGGGVITAPEFQIFNSNQSPSSLNSSNGGSHFPTLPMEVNSSQNSLSQNVNLNCPSHSNSVLVNSCPNFQENGFQQFYQQQQQQQQMVQRSPVAGIPVPVAVPVPVIPVVPGPIPNSWSPAHNHSFTCNSFYGNSSSNSNFKSAGTGMYHYANSTPPTKLNGNGGVKNSANSGSSAFDFDPLKYQEFNGYSDNSGSSHGLGIGLETGLPLHTHNGSGNGFKLATVASASAAVASSASASSYNFRNPNSNSMFNHSHNYNHSQNLGNGIVKKYSPSGDHGHSHQNGYDSLEGELTSGLTGGFSNLSLTTTATNNSFCKSCSLDFCSCQESLSSTLTKTSDRSHSQPQPLSQTHHSPHHDFDFESKRNPLPTPPLSKQLSQQPPQAQFQLQSQTQKVKSRGQRLNGKIYSPTFASPSKQLSSDSVSGSVSALVSPSKTTTGTNKAKGTNTTLNSSTNSSNKRHAYPHHRSKSNSNNYSNSLSRNAASTAAPLISSYD